MKNLLGKSVRTLRLKLAGSDWVKSVLACQFKHPGKLMQNRTGVELKEFAIVIGRNQFQFALDEYDRLSLLKNQQRATFRIDNGKFFIELKGLTLNVTSAEEIFILEEIFLRNVYGFVSNEEFNVIDVGMNVGFGSLYYTTFSNVSRVFSFEPFPETFEQALFNLSMNAKAASKISTFQFGLGEKPEEVWVDYDYQNKAQIGMHGVALVKGKLHSPKKQKLSLKPAYEEISKILLTEPGHYLLKVDCEGAEYMIIKNLDENNLLQRFDTIIIEWHENGPDELINILLRNSFSIFSQFELHKSIGILYARR